MDFYCLFIYPKMGQKLRQEIESEIGDRIPTVKTGIDAIMYGFIFRDIEH